MAVEATNPGQIQEFLRVLRRRRWQIVMPAIYVLALGTVFAVVVPKKMVITTRVEIPEGPRVETDIRLRESGGSAVEREVPNAANQLKHDRRIESVVQEEAGLWPEYMTADAEGKRDLIERIEDSLSVDVAPKSNKQGSTFIDITYSDVDGDRAVRFLEDLIDRWVKEVVTQDRTWVETDKEVYQDKRQTAYEERNQALGKFTDLAKEMGVDPQTVFTTATDRLPDPLTQSRADVQSELREVRLDIAEAQQRLADARKLLQEAPPTIPTEEGPEFQDLKVKTQNLIDGLKLQQKRLLPANKVWVKLQKQIDDALAYLDEKEKELAAEGTAVPNPDLVGLQASADEAQQRLSELQSRAKFLDQESDDLASKSEHRADQFGELQRLREDMQEKQEALDQLDELLRNKALALAELEANKDPYSIVRAASVDGAPTEPNAILIVLLAAFVGLALGLSMALAAEYARNSYRTVGDVAAVMNVPVLGTIDQIVTSAEARRQQARRAVVGLSSAVILGGLAWFTWIWSVSPTKLPTGVQQAIDEFRKLLM